MLHLRLDPGEGEEHPVGPLPRIEGFKGRSFPQVPQKVGKRRVAVLAAHAQEGGLREAEGLRNRNGPFASAPCAGEDVFKIKVVPPLFDARHPERPVFDTQILRAQEVRELGLSRLPRQPFARRLELAPFEPAVRLDVVEDVLHGLLFEGQGATERQKGRIGSLHEVHDVRRRRPREGAKTGFKGEFLSGRAHEVEHRETHFVRALSQAASQLLQEDRHRLGRAQEENRVHFGDVDALVVDVDRTEKTKFAAHEPSRRIPAFFGGGFPVYRGRGNAGFAQHLRDVRRMAAPRAEDDPPHVGEIGEIPPKSSEHRTVAIPRRTAFGVEVFEFGRGVASARPLEAGERHRVRHHQVFKRHEKLLVDRLAETEFGRDASAEPLEHVPPVPAPGRGREA